MEWLDAIDRVRFCLRGAGDRRLPPGTVLAFSPSGTFAPLVLGPATAAGEHFAEDRVEKGLEELAPDKLRGALDRAIIAVATHAASRPELVRRLFPQTEIEAILGRLAETQARAVAVWRTSAGGLGGLLGRATQMPGEGRAPAVSERIRALAETMQRDKAVAQPLHAVAEDIAAWEALTARLIESVRASSELRASYRKRQIRNLAIAAAIAAAIVTAAIIAWGRWVARSHVLAAIAKEDPCAAFDLSATDLGRVSAELTTKVDEKRRACEDKRAAEARRIEEERQRKEREEADRKAKAKREADCDALASHVEAGKLTPEDEAFANDGGLTKRIAEGSLEGKDFGPDDPKMPCDGTKAEARLWDAFSKMVVAKPWVMLVATAPAPRVRAAFVPDGGKMPFKMRKVIATRANDLGKFAIRSGKVEDAARASAWCEVARAVGMPMAGPCDLADKIVKGR